MSEQRTTEILEQTFGTATLSQAVVGALDHSTVALAANAERKYALIQNDSDVVVYIMLGAAAVAGTGIRLAVGASFEMSKVKGNLDARVINCIHGSAGLTKNLLVIEG